MLFEVEYSRLLLCVVSSTSSVVQAHAARVMFFAIVFSSEILRDSFGIIFFYYMTCKEWFLVRKKIIIDHIMKACMHIGHVLTVSTTVASYPASLSSSPSLYFCGYDQMGKNNNCIFCFLSIFHRQPSRLQ